jgi:adenylate kinase family enzyme
VLVVGTSGAGKTTVAAALARQLAVPHIELDTLFWEPNWEQADFDVFRGRIVDAIATDGWVVCGNYRPATIDITWPRADTVVWLDLARHLIMRRIIMRTAVRIGRRDALWNGNRESLRGAVARDSIIRWAWTSFARNRERYTEMATDPRLAHLRWVRLQSPRAVQRFLQTSVA